MEAGAIRMQCYDVPMQAVEQVVLPIRKITVREFEHMLEADIFRPDERLELLFGEIFRVTPQSDPHALSMFRSQDVLQAHFGRGYFVRCQAPLKFGYHSRPGPDLAVVKGRPRDWEHGVHATALLVVEVEFSRLDR